MVFRIEHIDNLDHILRNGMFTKAHASVNPNHVFIGHAQLTADRHAWPVLPCDIAQPEEYGTLGDYVPFYFGPRSPMLYVIKNGYQGVPRRSQRDIVYLCCRFRIVEQSGTRFAFTDGHAKNRVTAFYGQSSNLNNLHWGAIYAAKWNNREDDLDRERRKQAEMLVHDHVPPEWIDALVVYDDDVRTFAQNLLQRANHKAIVRVNPTQAFDGCGFYYP